VAAHPEYRRAVPMLVPRLHAQRKVQVSLQ
jgi:hypothetical protein